MDLVAAGAGEKRRGVDLTLEAGGERAEHALHALRIGTRGFRLLLRAPQPRRRHHLLRRRDFLRRADGADAVPQFLEGGHVALRFPQAKVLAKSSRNETSAFSLSPVISRLSRMSARICGALARRSDSIDASKRLTWATSILSR